MSTGYVIREAYLRLSAEKPGGGTLRDLESLVRLVIEVNQAELSFSARLAAARGEARPPKLSAAAMEQVDLSTDADSEVHRLLLRRCRRAESARGVLSELLTMAEDELQLDEDLLTEFEDGDVAKQLHLELVDMKRDVVERLRTMTREAP